MHVGGVVSWEAREGTDPALHFALRLRDALGVRSAEGMPRLRGGVSPREPATPEVQQEWRRWFAALYSDLLPEWADPRVVYAGLDGPHGPMDSTPVDHAVALLRGLPHLRPAATAVLDAALAQARDDDERHRDLAMCRTQTEGMVLTDAVTRLERQLGRPVTAFRLRIDTLPLERDGVWWLGDEWIAVTDTLRDDPRRWRAELDTVIAALA